MTGKLTLLIRKCQLNQEDAKQDFYDCFFKLADEICSDYADTRAEKLELIEAGFRKVFKYLYSFDARRDPGAVEFNEWFRKMMIYAAVERFRNHFTHSSFLCLEQSKLQHFLHSLDIGLKPTRKELKDTISKLPATNKLILHLMIMYGFTSKDMARCLEISHQHSELLISKSFEAIQLLLRKGRHPVVKHSYSLQ